MQLIGRRTLLFTDIEGSTALLQRVGHPRYVDLLDRHHQILHAAFSAHDGEEIQNEGDSFVVLFPTTASGLGAAVEAQLALAAGPWPEGETISVRMGLHDGEIGLSDSGHHGLALHEAARVASAAHGGQILVSEAARAPIVAELPDDSPVSLLDLGDFALKDIGARVALSQVAHPQLAADFPPPRTAGSSRHNLPAQLTSLVGRSKDAATVVDLVTRNRLVSLLGDGGVGKTRLALQAATTVGSQFPGGVWLVELASLERGASIIEETRRSMRIPDDGRGDETVAAAIHTQRTLLVLDNCEHMLDDVAAAVDTLTRVCPNLHVLTTSREPIGTIGEVRWRVPSLDIDSSIELLVARAEHAAPSLQISATDRDTLERVSRRLEGIPLAIELVAARLSTIPVTEIESRLLDRFELLNVGSRAPLRRHQTLHAALDWSYQLLTPDEQLTLRRLDVFPNVFEIAAAEAVLANDRLTASDVANLVESLHEKSLVKIDRTRTPPPILRSEIVRQFAATLETDHDRAADEQRHAEYFADWCGQALHGSRGPERSTWLARIEANRDNLSAAYEWNAARRPDVAVSMLTGLKSWLSISDERLWRRRLQEISDREDLDPATTATANALRAVLGGGYGFETAALAGVAAERAVAHLDAVTRPTERIRVLTDLALGSREADPELASDLAQQAVAAATELDDAEELIASLLELLLVHHEHHPITNRFRTMLFELIDRGDSDRPSVHPLVDGALAIHQVGRHDEAIALLTRAEQMLPSTSRSTGMMPEDVQVWTVWSVLIRAEVGDTETAILLAEDTLALFGESDRLQTKTMLSNYGQALLIEGRFDEAAAAFSAAVDHVDGWRYIGFAIASMGLSTIDIERGRPHDAIDRLVPIARTNRRSWVRARAYDVMARAWRVLGDESAANADAAQAASLRREYGFVVPPALRTLTGSAAR